MLSRKTRNRGYIMKKRLISLLLVLVLIIGLTSTATASSPRVSFGFNVLECYDTYGNIFGPIVGAQVVIYRDGTEVTRVSTNAHGLAGWRGAIGNTYEFSFRVILPSGWIISDLGSGDNIVSTVGHRHSVLSQDIIGSPFYAWGYYNVIMWWETVTGSGTPEPPEPEPPRSPQVYPFTDVPTTAWYASAVEFVHNTGIMSGTSPTTFEPNTNFTRAMLSATLHRMTYGQANSGTPTSNPFTDVPANAWFAPYVSWANRVGIAQGTTATNFSPNAPVSRQDFALFMYRFANYFGIDTSVPSSFTMNFSDANSVGSWAREAMRWAVYNDLITGTGQQLVPTGTATRAQSATILSRFVQTFLTA